MYFPGLDFTFIAREKSAEYKKGVIVRGYL